MLRSLTITFLFILFMSSQSSYASEELAYSVAELRHAKGSWIVTTEFIGADGNVAKSVEGTYQFKWVIEDKLLTGTTLIPELGMAAGILFYVNETAKTIEMVSVGADGKRWVMTGPLGSDTRTTEPYVSQDGGQGMLRFTRFNVKPNSFESKMEYTNDNGETWTLGNHQNFVRGK